MQLCAEYDGGETVESAHDSCMHGLKASAQVLEAAVSTVAAAAAAQTGQQQPSEQLVDTCFTAVCDLLGASVLQP